METMENQIKTLIRTSRLSRIADEVEALLRASIRIKCSRVDESSLALGASKFGGLPDLPPEQEWPMWYGKRPHSLLAQIRLAEVAPYDHDQVLPPTGMLYFFVHETYGNCDDSRVIYYDGDLSLLRHRSAPAAEDLALYHPCALTFSSQFMLPHLYTLEDEVLDRLGLATGWRGNEGDAPKWQDSDAYELLKERIEELSFAPGFAEQGEDSSAVTVLHYPHQLLGYGWPVQELVEGDDARLLLQIADDPDVGTVWGDLGSLLYVYLSQEALVARDFSQAEMFSEST